MIAALVIRTKDAVTAATWAGFAMMCVGMFMAVLDVQVVATSLPTIRQALGIAQDQMSWIQTAYLIAAAAHRQGRLAQAINEAWALIALATLAALVVVPLARRTPRSEQTLRHA